MDFGGFRAVRAPFDKDGNIAALGPVDGSHVADELAALVPQIDDLIVISHGWNNNVPEAQALYDEFLANVRAQWAAAGLKPSDADRTGVLALYWPSKRFEESDLISGGAASIDDASAAGPDGAPDYQAKIEAQVANLRDADGQFPPTQQALLDEILEKSRSLDDPASQTAFVVALAKLMPAAAEPDPGLDVLTVRDAQENGSAILQEVATQAGGGAFVARASVEEGGAAAVGDLSASFDASGGAAGFDPLGGIKKAAWLMLNLTTYYTMKERAGTLGPIAAKLVLAALKQKPALRVHLVGHSFGGRLVTSLANALPDGGPSAASMILLQAAFSHYGLAPAPSPGQAARPAGAFRGVVEKRKVRGWIQITHSNHDWAVGAGYPLASSVARQAAAGIADVTVPSTAGSLWGGMGANGAQQTPETYDADMLANEGPYPPPDAKLPAPKRTIRNINGNAFISSHGSVRGKEVTWAFLQGFVAARAS
jgi:dienelactone hydrolase